ncbi:hypothetical protein BDQ12DRAFT_718134 [Crucibulum laeve]|uniref:Uncharacterized protein n=1 Tax=Crucibulum laeve TaxID=68775 RepID=A0A5C3MKZ4_9AGAR|nr:hypothetical protein BDQ12DRAFT_718134 [Crucibulum laeve]
MLTQEKLFAEEILRLEIMDGQRYDPNGRQKPTFPPSFITELYTPPCNLTDSVDDFIRRTNSFQMDTQRYDLFERHVSSKRSAFSIQTKATSGHQANASEESSGSRGIPTVRVYREVSEEDSDASDGSFVEISSAGSQESSVLETTPALYKSGSSDSVTLKDEVFVAPNPNEVHHVDVFEKGDYTTTRTIVRPVSSSSFLSLSIFSRPSSSVKIDSRPTSPFGNLNCLGSLDAFEEDVLYLQTEREKQLAGVQTGAKVRVIQERNVFMEESWRDAVQQVLYGSHQFDPLTTRIEVE